MIFFYEIARPDQISLKDYLSFGELKVWAFGCLSFEFFENWNPGFWEKSLFAKVVFSQKWSKFLGNFFFQPLDIGFRCFVPKNHENWLNRLGAMAKKLSKTWFFMFFDFLAFLTHPNDQKRFWRARYYFFHVWTPLKKFRQNSGTPSTKVFGPVWIQSFASLPSTKILLFPFQICFLILFWRF